jgi:nucleoside phosphorylase
MKIMLIEDDRLKHEAIALHLKSKGVLEKDIIHAWNMTDFSAKLKEDIELFIIDFKLPCIDNVAPSQNAKAILETIKKAGKHNALLIAISSYPDDFRELRELYEANGCILADYANKSGWQSTLDHLLIQLKKNLKFDFVIFCALNEERNPYATLIAGKQINRGGIDCYDIPIGDAIGTVVLLPKMGLVNAAVIAGLCIDRFRPSFVGMSGICGGFEGRADIGQLFVSSMAYEYQSGKWASDGFRQEPYQVHTDNATLTDLNILTSAKGLIAELEQGFSGTFPLESRRPTVGIFTSGSAVIADGEYIKQIEVIHRKVNALDMEVFAILRAAELSSKKPRCVCAKTVVDLCNEDKGDDIHSYGAYISAKFLIKAVDQFLMSD